MAWLNAAIAAGASHAFLLDEASGTVLTESINSRHGEVVGATRLSTTTPGGGAGYATDGVDDRLMLGQLQQWATAVATSGAFTIELLFRTTESAQKYLLGLNNNANTLALDITLNSGAASRTRLGYRTPARNEFGRVSFDNAAVYNGSWHHLLFRATLGSYPAARLDKVNQTITATGVGTPGTDWGALEFPLALGCRNLRGVFDQFAAAGVAAVAFYPSSLSDLTGDGLYDELFAAADASAGPDQTVIEGETVTLAASGSGAGSWTQTSGPTVALSSTTDPAATFIAPRPPTGQATAALVFTWTVGTASDSVTITTTPSVFYRLVGGFLRPVLVQSGAAAQPQPTAEPASVTASANRDTVTVNWDTA